MNIDMLPNVVIQKILMDTNDHKTVCRFGQTNKKNNKISNTDIIWGTFLERKFYFDRKNDPCDQKNYKKIFKMNVNLLKETEEKKFTSFKLGRLVDFTGNPDDRFITSFNKGKTTFFGARDYRKNILSMEITHNIDNGKFEICETKEIFKLEKNNGKIGAFNKFDNKLFLMIENPDKVLVIDSHSRELLQEIEIVHNDGLKFLSGNEIAGNDQILAFHSSSWHVDLYQFTKEKTFQNKVRINANGCAPTISVIKDFIFFGFDRQVLGYNLEFIEKIPKEPIIFKFPENSTDNEKRFFRKKNTISFFDQWLFVSGFQSFYQFNVENSKCVKIFELPKDETQKVGDITCIEAAKKLGLIFIGSNKGYVLCYNTATSKCILKQKVCKKDREIRYMKFIETGLFIQRYSPHPYLRNSSKFLILNFL